MSRLQDTAGPLKGAQMKTHEAIASVGFSFAENNDLVRWPQSNACLLEIRFAVKWNGKETWASYQQHMQGSYDGQDSHLGWSLAKSPYLLKELMDNRYNADVSGNLFATDSVAQAKLSKVYGLHVKLAERIGEIIAHEMRKSVIASLKLDGLWTQRLLFRYTEEVKMEELPESE